MRGKVRDQGIIGNLSSLGKTIHPFAYFDIDVAVVDKWSKVVLCEDGLGDQGDWDHHVFVAVHVIVEVEVFEIHGHELGLGCGDDAVEQKFSSGKACGFGADVARVVNEVASDGPADSAWLCFFRAVGDNVAEIGGAAAFWDLVMADEMDGVGAFDLFVALGKAACFFCIGFFPKETLRTA